MIHPLFLLKARPLQGSLEFQGLPISIENRMGNIREWHDPHNGEDGATRMKLPYGYIRGSLGMDGGQLDVFVGPHLDAKFAYIVTQKKAPDFVEDDEQKVFLGLKSAEEAKKLYLSHYNDPRFFGKMERMPMDEFKKKAMRTKENGGILKALLLKSHVKAHLRMNASGKVSMVKEYDDKRKKKTPEGNKEVAKTPDGLDSWQIKKYLEEYETLDERAIQSVMEKDMQGWDEPYVTFHDSPSEKKDFQIQEKRPDGSSLDFGGIFSGKDGGMYGEYRHGIILKPEDVASHGDFENVNRKIAYSSIKDSGRRYANMSTEEMDSLWEVLTEEIEPQDLDEDVFEAIFGADDYSEASWEAQRLRGIVARAAGYLAVEMKDETGISVLVFPPIKTIFIGERSRRASNQFDQLVYDEWKRQNLKEKITKSLSTCHHEKKICKNCGATMTCRCREPKTTVEVDSCPNCRGSLSKAEFGNSFSGMKAGRKLTKPELVRAMRQMIAAEYEATQLYTQLADSIDDDLAAKVLRDVAEEEVVHAGEFLEVLKRLDPKEAELYKEGAGEVKDMSKALPGIFLLRRKK